MKELTTTMHDVDLETIMMPSRLVTSLPTSSNIVVSTLPYAGWYWAGTTRDLLGPEFEILSGADVRHHGAINSLLNSSF
jgi:hypothetical protein